MSAFWGNAIGVLIVVLMFSFVGYWIWLWRARHKKSFDRMSRLPMEDDITNLTSHPTSEENRHE
ncbi:MAG TPA: cbb3-type cytochrome c oxidase subunit 3 [Alcanivoracaceae bacterium]|nr:cbb3-type cytochrome c oxidase subunit 3 [Alcanivoracaceae bacterium]